MTTRGGDRGTITAWTAVVCVACLAMVGLVADGGRILRARSDAFGLAAAAARTGAQQLDPVAGSAGGVALRADRAQQAARDYLAGHDAEGAIAVDGMTVTATVTVNTRLVFLAPGRSTSVTATAHVDAVRGAGP